MVADLSEHPDDPFLVFARAAFEHRECRAAAEELLGGNDVTVVTQSPPASSATCAHGIRYWLVPSRATEGEP